MIIQADCQNLPLYANSIDLIFTDPPYSLKYLPCYRWLAEESARVLKMGGFVLAMCGGNALNEIYRMFDNAGLTYYWEFHYLILHGSSTYIFPKNLLVRSKVILAYSKGANGPRVGRVQTFYEGRRDKLWHHWGQDVDSARYYIDYFSGHNDLVLDPFIGGGTTAVACELIGRRWLGCDIDPAALMVTQQRLSNADIPYQGTMFEESICK